MTDIRSKLGVASECGKCSKLAKSIVSEFNKTATFINAG